MCEALRLRAQTHFSAEEPTGPPMVLCYYDPSNSTGLAPAFAPSDLCLECCTHLVFDGFDVDTTGSIRSAATGMQDWLALKNSSNLKVLGGLRFPVHPAYSDLNDKRITTLIESLRSHHTDWDGAVILWTHRSDKQYLLYEALKTEIGSTNFKIMAHVLPSQISHYNFSLMEKFLHTVVVETHNFAVHSKAYPPCMYENAGNMEILNKTMSIDKVPKQVEQVS
ncbi:uncharacterized protein LOC144146382 [Haemaphysalis longicornis]